MRFLRSRSFIVLAALATAIGVGVAALITPEREPSRTPVEFPATAPQAVRGVLDKVGEAEGASYKVRRLLVYLGEGESAAVVEEESSSEQTSVRSTDGEELWLSKDKGVVTGGDMQDSAPPRVPVITEEIVSKYDVRTGDAEQMLGDEVIPLELVRRSDGSLVERLWIHPEQGIVYRRELYASGGELVGMSMVLDMEWGEAADPSVVASGAHEKVEATEASDAPEELGYGYELVRAYRLEAEGRPAEHWIYSDGLHALSVFRTKGALERPAGFREVEVDDGTLWAGPGPGTWIWEGGDHTWTIVAEEPQLDPAELTAELPVGGPSVWSRLGRLWARGFGWVADRF